MVSTISKNCRTVTAVQAQLFGVSLGLPSYAVQRIPIRGERAGGSLRAAGARGFCDTDGRETL